MNITLNEFINAIFGELPDDECVVLAKPKDVGDGYKQVRWNPAKTYAPASWYFNVSSCERKRGPVTRAKVDCRAVFCIVLDDIGTKAKVPPIEPSWILESSPGNFQYGYILEEPMEDLDKAEALWRGICRAGYSDDIATASRIMRVPGSINLKPENDGWVAVMHRWEPELTFNLEQMCDDLDVQPVAAGTKAVDTSLEDELATWVAANCTGVTEPEPGKFRMDCPWSHEHTDGASGACYWAIGYQGRHTRGFDCRHAHCSHRDIHDFVAWAHSQGAGAFTSTGHVEITNDHRALMAITPQLSRAELPDVQLTAQGVPKAQQLCSPSNIIYAMEQLSISARVNLMTKAPELTAPWSDDIRRVDNVLMNKLQLAGIDKDKYSSIVADICMGNPYHPIAEALPEWDGIDRFEALVATATVEEGLEDAWRLFLRRWLLQAVKAWTSWGEPVQVGGVLVFVGAQNIGKSRWIERLHPACQGGVTLQTTNKDSIMESMSSPIVELGELDATFRKSDISALKAMLTKRVDIWRTPYARRAEHWPRVTVFAASVNVWDFLQDSSGNRRFWPVVVNAIDADHDIDMMQLYAQMKVLLDAGELWYLSESECALQIEVAENHRLLCEVENTFNGFFHKRDKLPRKEWTHANAHEVLHLMGAPGASARDASVCVELLTKRFGAKKQRNKLRGWWIPVSKSERNVLGAPVKEGKAGLREVD